LSVVSMPKALHTE